MLKLLYGITTKKQLAEAIVSEQPSNDIQFDI